MVAAAAVGAQTRSLPMPWHCMAGGGTEMAVRCVKTCKSLLLLATYDVRFLI